MLNTILISGANSNIGSALAKRYLLEGKKLVLLVHDRTEHIQEIDTHYRSNTLLLEVDISNADSVKETFLRLKEHPEFEPDAMIHAAAMRSSDHNSLADTNMQLSEKIVQVNLLGTIYLLHSMIPIFRVKKAGKIILFGSNVSRTGLSKGSVYSATKAAVANLARTVAQEEGVNRILINTISPGPVAIDDSHFSEDYRTFREQYYERELAQIPLGRFVEYDDIFTLVDFLISDKNRYITGEEFYVTGGKL